MTRPLRFSALAWLAAAVTALAATPVTYTQTNVLQNINLQFTIYQQNPPSPGGKKVTAQITSYTTKSLISALEAVTGQKFGTGAKLVRSTVYSMASIPLNSETSNVLSTNLTVPPNATLIVGGGSFYDDTVLIVISGDTYISGGVDDLANNLVTTVGGSTTNSVIINTNAGFITTITLAGDILGNITNAFIVTDYTPTETVLTNTSTSISILYGGAANELYLVDNYFSFATNNSAEVVVETGAGLDTTNALTVTNLASQTGYSMGGLTIAYPGAVSNILTLNLQGFVKNTLKVDTLYAHGTNKVVEDIFGGSSAWSVIGSGYTGGTYTGAPIYLSNASPVVVQGSMSVSFLKNLPEP